MLAGARIVRVTAADTGQKLIDPHVQKKFLEFFMKYVADFSGKTQSGHSGHFADRRRYRQLMAQAAGHGRAGAVLTRIRERDDLEAARYAASGAHLVANLLEYLEAGSSPATRGRSGDTDHPLC